MTWKGGYQDGIMMFFYIITLGYIRNKKETLTYGKESLYKKMTGMSAKACCLKEQPIKICTYPDV